MQFFKLINYKIYTFLTFITFDFNLKKSQILIKSENIHILLRNILLVLFL